VLRNSQQASVNFPQQNIAECAEAPSIRLIHSSRSTSSLCALNACLTKTQMSPAYKYNL
jgi:hypothetical protein